MTTNGKKDPKDPKDVEAKNQSKKRRNAYFLEWYELREKRNKLARQLQEAESSLALALKRLGEENAGPGRFTFKGELFVLVQKKSRDEEGGFTYYFRESTPTQDFEEITVEKSIDAADQPRSSNFANADSEDDASST